MGEKSADEPARRHRGEQDAAAGRILLRAWASATSATRRRSCWPATSAASTRWPTRALEDLAAVPTIGPKTAESVYEYFQDEQNRALIEKLREAGVRLDGRARAAREGPLQGLTFVVTGSLDALVAQRDRGADQAPRRRRRLQRHEEDELPRRGREPRLEAREGAGVRRPGAGRRRPSASCSQEKGVERRSRLTSPLYASV